MPSEDTQFKKGHKHSEEWKENARKRMLGNNYGIKTRFKKGYKKPPVSDETRKKQSESHKGNHYPKISEAKLGKKRPNIMGENHPNYKGGITPENKSIRDSVEYREWRNAVFERDNWTCKKYGKVGGSLVPHHIKNFSQFPELRFSVENGITLSEKAHREFHKKYGYQNNNLQQIKEFINLPTCKHAKKGKE